MAKKWYVVIVGHQVGVFTDWLDVVPLVSRVAGAQYRSYGSESEARIAYQRALDSGHVRVVDSEFVRPRNTASTSSGTDSPMATSSPPTSQFCSSPLDLTTFMPKKWYVVIAGRRVGVFSDWLEVAPLIGRAGSQHKSYATESEARAAYQKALENGYVREIDPITSTVRAPGSPVSASASASPVIAPGFEPDTRYPGLHPNVTIRGTPSPKTNKAIGKRRAHCGEDSQNGARVAKKEFLSQSVPVSNSPNCSRHVHGESEMVSKREHSLPTLPVRSLLGSPVAPVDSRVNGREKRPSRNKTPPRTPSLAHSSTRAVHSGSSSMPFVRNQTRRRSSAEATRSPTVTIIVADLSDVESYPSDSGSDSDESSGPEDVTPGRLLSPINSPHLSTTQDVMQALNFDRITLCCNEERDSRMQCTPGSAVHKQVKDVGVTTSTSPRFCSADVSSRHSGKSKEDLLGLIGMSQPSHVQSIVHEPEFDPRSPIRDLRTLIPGQANTAFFGRPSPKILVDTSVSSPALFKR